jgi:hypothetical protein
MRFRQYREGWAWEARCGDFGKRSSRCFPSREHAIADAERSIAQCDNLAEAREFMRRLRLRGSVCQLTPWDGAAIIAAGFGEG